MTTKSAPKKITKSKSTSTKPATTKSSSTKPTDPEVTILKKSNCPNLSQTGTIGYEISSDDTGAILFRLTSNSGAGYFNSKFRVGLNDALEALKNFEKQFPIISLAFKEVCPKNSSINNWSFLTALFLQEGLVEKHPDHPRRYRLCSPDAFLASLEKLKTTHSSSTKGTLKTKAKAASRISKSASKKSTKPATGS
jgi:hypothetical protein